MFKKLGRGWLAVLCSIALLGTGAVMVTPAANALSGINWSNAWKHEIQPRADQRYLTKKAAKKKFAPKPKTLRGQFIVDGVAANIDDPFNDNISFGWDFKSPPKVHIIAPGGAVPHACAGGRLTKPKAKPGHLCLFERYNNNTGTGLEVCDMVNNCDPTASRYGAWLIAFAAAPGRISAAGSWAATPKRGVSGGKVSAPSAHVNGSGPGR